MMSDVVNAEGILLSVNELKLMYCLSIHFIYYFIIRALVKMIAVNKQEDNFDVSKPYIPIYVKTIINPKKQIRDAHLINRENKLISNEVE